MKLVDTKDAVGQMLCHDITQIIPGKVKDAVFRKGHIITEEDIPVLLSVGKEHIYIWETNENMMHEDDAAQVLYDLSAGDNMHASGVKEGKIELIADCDGLLKIDRERLNTVNSFGEMMIASRHGDFAVKKGDKIAGTRIIPLIIEKEKMQKVQAAVEGAKIFNILPFKAKKYGIVTTGSEVFSGRIEDQFTPVLIGKLKPFGGEMVGHAVCGDDHVMITEKIHEMLDLGAEFVLCSGGMSVDPDDRTPLAIKNTGTKIVTYGAPVFPGAMFMLSYYGEKNIPIVGLPGCVMYAKRTIFDLVLPRIMADDIMTKEDLDMLGEGGLCLDCDVCTFPNCGFGK